MCVPKSGEENDDLERITYVKCRLWRKKAIERYSLKILDREEENNLWTALKFKPHIYLINKGFPAEFCLYWRKQCLTNSYNLFISTKNHVWYN